MVEACLGALADTADGLDIALSEADFVAVNPKAALLVGEAQAWGFTLVRVVVCVLNQL